MRFKMMRFKLCSFDAPNYIKNDKNLGHNIAVTLVNNSHWIATIPASLK